MHPTLAIILADTILAVFHKRLIILFVMLELSRLWWNTAGKNLALITQACSRFDLAHSLNPFQMPSLLLSDLCHNHCTQETALPVARVCNSFLRHKPWQRCDHLTGRKGKHRKHPGECPPGKTRPEGLGSLGEGTQIKDKRDYVLKLCLQSCI